MGERNREKESGREKREERREKREERERNREESRESWDGERQIAEKSERKIAEYLASRPGSCRRNLI